MPDTPRIGNGLVQFARLEEYTGHTSCSIQSVKSLMCTTLVYTIAYQADAFQLNPCVNTKGNHLE